MKRHSVFSVVYLSLHGDVMFAGIQRELAIVLAMALVFDVFVARMWIPTFATLALWFLLAMINRHDPFYLKYLLFRQGKMDKIYD